MLTSSWTLGLILAGLALLKIILLVCLALAVTCGAVCLARVLRRQE